MHLENNRLPWLLPLTLAAWGAVAALLALKLAGETVDDFFITFRYSQNLLAGDGFVFNPGERVFGTTAPGWGLLIALASAGTGLAPAVVATFLTALALLATAGWLLGDARRGGRMPEAALAGTLMLTSSFVWVHNGSEIFAALALLVAAARSQCRPALAGALAGASVWLRPEAGLAGLLLGALGWRKDRTWPLRYGLVFSAIVGGGLLAATLYFGEPLPNTLEAKRLQVAWKPETWPGGAAFWRHGWRWMGAAYAGPWIGLLAVGGGFGLLSLLRSGQRALQLLAVYCLALGVAYPLLGVPFYTWYAIPVLVGCLYGLAFLAGDAARFARARLPGKAAFAVLVLILGPVAAFSLHVSERTVRGYLAFEAIPQTELYRAAGQWLQASSRPEADIAYVEVGALAYYSDRPVRDLLGLVSPENLPFVATRDLAAAVRARGPDFVAHHSRLGALMDPVVRDPWFRANYEPGMTFRGELTADELTLYRRRPDSRLETDAGPAAAARGPAASGGDSP